MLDYSNKGESVKTYEEYEFEDTCKIKQGYLGIITFIDKSEEHKELEEIIHIKPVFTVLNKKTISFFENEHVTNLFKSINLNHVTHTKTIPELVGNNMWCFKVYRV